MRISDWSSDVCSSDLPYSSDYALANLRVERQWDDLRFGSSTGFVRNILTESYDATPYEMAGADAPAALFRQRNKVDIFSTENRIVRDLDNGLGWILGASYLESTSDIQRSLTSYGTDLLQPRVIRSEERRVGKQGARKCKSRGAP